METNIFTEKRDVHCTQTISQEGKKREQNKISPLIQGEDKMHGK